MSDRSDSTENFTKMTKPSNIFKNIHILGAGKVGQTLGHLMLSQGAHIGSVCNQTVESSQKACTFIGGGIPVDFDGFVDMLIQQQNNNQFNDPMDLAPLKRKVDLVLVCVPDRALSSVVASLTQQFSKFSAVVSASLVFVHVSGVHEADVLSPLGPHFGSVHPIHSFSSVARSVVSFDGCYCGYEAPFASEFSSMIMSQFSAIGAKLVPIEASRKLIYHSGAVFASNFIPVLMACAMESYKKAGFDEVSALGAISHIAKMTLNNAITPNPVDALTGPVSRGDSEFISKQLEALKSVDAPFMEYAELSKLTARWLLAQNSHNEQSLKEIISICTKDSYSK